MENGIRVTGRLINHLLYHFHLSIRKRVCAKRSIPIMRNLLRLVSTIPSPSKFGHCVSPILYRLRRPRGNHPLIGRRTTKRLRFLRHSGFCRTPIHSLLVTQRGNLCHISLILQFFPQGRASCYPFELFLLQHFLFQPNFHHSPFRNYNHFRAINSLILPWLFLRNCRFQVFPMRDSQAFPMRFVNGVLMLQPSIHVRRVIRNGVTLLLYPGQDIRTPILFPIIPFPNRYRHGNRRRRRRSPRKYRRSCFYFHNLVRDIAFFRILILSKRSTMWANWEGVPSHSPRVTT